MLGLQKAWGIPYWGAFFLVLCVGYRHWAHLLLPVYPCAVGLGPVSPGELQEAGVKGAVLSLSLGPDQPQPVLIMFAAFLASLPHHGLQLQ